jgi:hypothetical protein
VYVKTLESFKLVWFLRKPHSTESLETIPLKANNILVLIPRIFLIQKHCKIIPNYLNISTPWLHLQVMLRLWLKSSFEKLSLAVQFAAEGWWRMQPKEPNHWK